MSNLHFSVKKNTFLILIATIIVLFPFSKVHALTVSPIRFELSGDPGKVLQEKITLRNEQDETKTYFPNYYNFQADGETGTPTFTKSKDGLASWMAAPAGIILLPGESKEITFTISIPDNAEPGGYFSAVLYGTTPPDQQGGTLVIGAQTGPIVLLRVNGDIKESASVLEFNVKDKQSFFTALPVEMYYRFQNTGADRTKPGGELVIRNIFGLKATVQNPNPVEGNVLPGQIRRYDLVWKKADAPTPEAYASKNFFKQASYEWHNFALGYFTANLNLNFGSNNKNAAHAEVKFFVLPWQLLIVLTIIFFIAIWIIKTILRNYNRWIIKQAEIAIESSQAKKEKRQTKSPRRKI